MPPTPQTLIENTIPVLPVANVPASIRFYLDVLDFKCDWGGDKGDASPMASVSRDGHSIMLQRRKPVTPGCVWIGVSELVSLWEKIRTGHGDAVVQRPTNQPYALEMRIKDPDGNILWLGTDPLKGVPFDREVTEEEMRRS